MSLSWLKYFVWVALIHTSFQYQGPDGNFSGISNDSTMLSYSAKPIRDNCVCSDKHGKIYNLLPIANNGTRRFKVKHKGYWFSYNPCISFKEGKGRGCQSDVAICWWAQNGGPDTYKTIGKQSKAKCHFNKTKKTLVYRSSAYPHRKVKVQVKCDKNKTKKEDALFEIIPDEDDWVFRLTHLCGCGDGCPIDPVKPIDPAKRTGTTPAVPFDPMRIATPVASSVGTAVLILVVLWCLKRRNNDNGNNEQQNLLGNGAGDQYENVIRPPVEESNSERRSRPVPDGSSRDKADVNRSANA
ncbi:hypothetical protein OS493_000743 [Desmophyllum pertusum]|uniref:Uncharacterized protein n=1 Tax=Desmophyllum pertusum TaxID=174260 RepID=A0A9X0A7L9_9CNID|nr:hypothetical protein OS493_000743 [Desmophyllum pertusum]